MIILNKLPIDFTCSSMTFYFIFYLKKKKILDDFNFTYTLICLYRFIYFNLKRTPSTLFIFFATLTQFIVSPFHNGMWYYRHDNQIEEQNIGYKWLLWLYGALKIHLIYEPTQLYFTKIIESAMKLLRQSFNGKYCSTFYWVKD